MKLIRERDRAEVVFARDDKPVNVLDEPTLSELEAALDALEEDTPSACVFRSALERCFIAGADVDAIAKVQDEATAQALAER
ncbi:MAG: fatty oxidation complex subunit alpha, partial [Zetaproteobacteria bacterium]